MGGLDEMGSRSTASYLFVPLKTKHINPNQTIYKLMGRNCHLNLVVSLFFLVLSSL